MSTWDFSEPGWRSAWRKVADQPAWRDYRDEFWYGLDSYSDLRSHILPRFIHPLDEHLSKHAEYLGLLLHSADQQRPDGADLLNAKATATLVEYRDEALCLLMEAYRRGADTEGCSHLNHCIDDVSTWLDIAQAAQRLVGDWSSSRCAQCTHWQSGVPDPGDPDGIEGYCAARNHSRTGNSNACQQFEVGDGV